MSFPFSNEVLFFIAFLLNMVLVLGAFVLDKNHATAKPFLYGLIAANILFTAFFGGKLFTVFGFMVSVSVLSYTTLFVLFNLLNHFQGVIVARQAVWMGAFVLVGYYLFQFFVFSFAPHASSFDVSQALALIFQTTPRLLLASVLSYLLAHHLNVWLFDYLKTRFAQKELWVHHNGATLTAQFFDSFIFFAVAFAGVLPNLVVLQLILITFVFKALLSVLATPFLYACGALIHKTPHKKSV